MSGKASRQRIHQRPDFDLPRAVFLPCHLTLAGIGLENEGVQLKDSLVGFLIRHGAVLRL